MLIKFARFNIYLFLACIVFMSVTGCETTSDHPKKKGKVATLVEFHMETRGDIVTRTQMVPIDRASPVYVNVDRKAFLDCADLVEADLVEELGGFVIRLRFGMEGSTLLDTCSSANLGKRMAVLCISDQTRWLAAPKITKPIRDGIITFTPDASRDEAEKIIAGLKEVIKELKKAAE